MASPIPSKGTDNEIDTYQDWPEQHEFAEGTVQTQISRAAGIEECHGNLDARHDRDQLRSVIDELKYSIGDEHRNRPDSSRIPLDSNIRINFLTQERG